MNGILICVLNCLVLGSSKENGKGLKYLRDFVNEPQSHENMSSLQSDGTELAGKRKNFKKFEDLLRYASDQGQIIVGQSRDLSHLNVEKKALVKTSVGFPNKEPSKCQQIREEVSAERKKDTKIEEKIEDASQMLTTLLKLFSEELSALIQMFLECDKVSENIKLQFKRCDILQNVQKYFLKNLEQAQIFFDEYQTQDQVTDTEYQNALNQPEIFAPWCNVFSESMKVLFDRIESALNQSNFTLRDFLTFLFELFDQDESFLSVITRVETLLGPIILEMRTAILPNVFSKCLENVRSHLKAELDDSTLIFSMCCNFFEELCLSLIQICGRLLTHIQILEEEPTGMKPSENSFGENLIIKIICKLASLSEKISQIEKVGIRFFLESQTDSKPSAQAWENHSYECFNQIICKIVKILPQNEIENITKRLSQMIEKPANPPLLVKKTIEQLEKDQIVSKLMDSREIISGLPEKGAISIFNPIFQCLHSCESFRMHIRNFTSCQSLFLLNYFNKLFNLMDPILKDHSLLDLIQLMDRDEKIERILQEISKNFHFKSDEPTRMSPEMALDYMLMKINEQIDKITSYTHSPHVQSYFNSQVCKSCNGLVLENQLDYCLMAEIKIGEKQSIIDQIYQYYNPITLQLAYEKDKCECEFPDVEILRYFSDRTKLRIVALKNLTKNQLKIPVKFDVCGIGFQLQSFILKCDQLGISSCVKHDNVWYLVRNKEIAKIERIEYFLERGHEISLCYYEKFEEIPAKVNRVAQKS